MTPERIIACCLEKKTAWLDYPYKDGPACLRIRAGKRIPVFVQLYADPKDFKVTIKCGPAEAEFFRAAYPGTITRGYYCPPSQQPYWNTIWLGDCVPEGAQGVPDDELLAMFNRAFDYVVSQLPKYMQREYFGLNP